MALKVAHLGWGSGQTPLVVASSTINGLAASVYQTWAFRRAEITAFVGSPFRLPSGNMLSFARVRQLDPRMVGADRLEALAVRAMSGLRDALARIPLDARLGIVIGLPERMDPERAADRDRRARRRIESAAAGPLIEYGYELAVRVLPLGHAWLAYGLLEVGEMMSKNMLDLAILLGVDSHYDPYVLEEHFERERVLDTDWRDAFVPGEAATALLIASPFAARQLGYEVLGEIESVATNEEVATLDNDVGLLALGLSRPAVAVCKKLKQAKQRATWWIADVTGESFRVREFQLAWPRAAHLVMEPGDQFDFLPSHLGDIGAASMPTALALGIEGLRRGAPDGRYGIVSGSSDGGMRGVVSFSRREPR